MNKILILLVFCLILSTVSCYRNPVERNTIVFKDNVMQVKDSLTRMIYLLKKLPANEPCNINYDYDHEGHLAINGCTGVRDSISLDLKKPLAKFTCNEQNEFISLASYLKQNYISAGFSYYSTKLWAFEYRYLPEGDSNDSRTIMVLNSDEVPLTSTFDKVLDRKNTIYLLAGADAKIR